MVCNVPIPARGKSTYPATISVLLRIEILGRKKRHVRLLGEKNIMNTHIFMNFVLQHSYTHTVVYPGLNNHRGKVDACKVCRKFY